jgi:diguanylate cyclase (GGDEF)-like protein/PAS domain S-box-containing protein
MVPGSVPRARQHGIRVAKTLTGLVPAAHIESVRESNVSPTPVPTRHPGTRLPSDPAGLRVDDADVLQGIADFAAVMQDELEDVITADASGVLTEAGPSACETFGLEDYELKGRNLFGLIEQTVVPDGSDIVARFQAMAADRTSGPMRIHTSLERHDGSQKRVRISLRYVRNRRTGAATSIFMRVIDEDANRTDAIGIANKQEFNRKIVEEIERLQRGGQPLSLLMLDLDHFKRVNDEYGHLAGDAVLAKVARVISETVRRIDTVARYGGEEIAVLLPGTDAEGALLLADRIRERVERLNVRFEEKDIKVTISIGASTLEERHCRLQDDGIRETLKAHLVARADAALYEAKQNGRNRVCVRAA